MRRIDELLNDSYKTHLFPFFWQKGQSDDVTREYLHAMHDQGLRAFCVENRPLFGDDAGFCDEAWWHTMDVILEEARALDMRVWILDDASFPTGVANHKVPEHLKKRYLACQRFDVEDVGHPVVLDVSRPSGVYGAFDPRHEGDRLVMCAKGPLSSGTEGPSEPQLLKDVTDDLHDGLLALDGPQSVYVLYETGVGAEDATRDHLDPMRREATQVLIDEVYERHYARYATAFGTTITAFFSDEPRFGNGPGADEVIGKQDSPLPWNADVARELALRGISPVELTALFGGSSERASEVRFAYMDVVSSLYSRNFSQALGDWCHAHGVAYVGHVIEDDNAHARLAMGPGHYYRAMAGEDVAGIDVIAAQVEPGLGASREYFHFAHVRMAASCAKLDPRKGGRVLCEAFGAYGWREGLQGMAWVTDHLLAHGVNTIVPHAFDPAPFPDFDCPPHFYAHGNNPQWPWFHVWAGYADRMCHLLSGGHKVARVGVLYHAFAEWSGDAHLFQEACRVLQQAQIETDIIFEDLLMEADPGAGTFSVNGFSYDALVVPGCERLPKGLLEKLSLLANCGARVLFEGMRPEGTGVGEVIALDGLPDALSDLADVRLSHPEPQLVSYHYAHADGHVWMFFNEDLCATVDVDVSLGTSHALAAYDAWANRLSVLDAANGAFRLHLEPRQSLVVVEANAAEIAPKAGELLASADEARLLLRSYDSNAWEDRGLCALDCDSVPMGFSGTMRYEWDVELERTDVLLRLPQVFEASRVEANGIPCGESIARDARFDLSQAAVIGKNHLVVEVANTLVHALRDAFSQALPYDPSGIVAPAELYELVP